MSCSLYYETATGRITQYMEPKLEHSLYGVPGVASIHLDWGSEELVEAHYVNLDTLEVEPRPEMGLRYPETQEVGQTFRVDGIPPGTMVRHPLGETQVDDGYIEMSFATPGEYRFLFTNFPYLEEEVYAVVG